MCNYIWWLFNRCPPIHPILCTSLCVSLSQNSCVLCLPLLRPPPSLPTKERQQGLSRDTLCNTNFLVLSGTITVLRQAQLLILKWISTFYFNSVFIHTLLPVLLWCTFLKITIQYSPCWLITHYTLAYRSTRCNQIIYLTCLCTHSVYIKQHSH